MSPRGKSLTDTDRATWSRFAQFVTPLPGRALPGPPAPPAASPPTKADTAALPPPISKPRNAGAPALLVTGQHPPGLDRSSWQRFSSGKLPAVRTLDLHGKTAHAAFHALDHFLRSAHADRIRCVEVITGRGSGEHGGVIRRELPHWLNLPGLRPLILAAAHPHAANAGSTRILLRRRI
jgi:DNA-nicking Smr family endonuclease